MVTPPLNGLILPGITRDSILSLARQWGRFKVTEGSITMPQVCKLIKEERVCIFITQTETNKQKMEKPKIEIKSISCFLVFRPFINMDTFNFIDIGIIRRWNCLRREPS